jgi:hypothetical protein
MQHGLEWIGKLGESPERDVRDLELASMLAQVLMVTKGFNARETRAAAEHARGLAEKSGNLAQLVTQVSGIYRSAMASCDYSIAALLADRLLDLAEREGSPASFGFACHAQVVVSFYRGDLAGAEEHFARWGSFLDAAGFRQVPGAAVVAIGTASWCASALGRVDSARQRVARVIAFGRDGNNPFDLAFARCFESWLYGWLREPHRAEVAATQALAIAEEHAFPAPRNMTRLQLGLARAQLGRSSEGVALIRPDWPRPDSGWVSRLISCFLLRPRPSTASSTTLSSPSTRRSRRTPTNSSIRPLP